MRSGSNNGLGGNGSDWLSWEQWKRIARAFNLDTGEGLRGRPAGTGHRQLQVLQGMVAGLEDAEIARALGITPKTLRGHIEELYRKMHVNRRDRAIIAAWRASLGK
jgi:DNA-binding NarL/FixJ family response regulator